MCLLLIAYQPNPKYRLILAANRDEFYDRPAAAATWWKEQPHLLAGRDLRAGGTWLGVTREGRLAAVTNFREIGPPIKSAESRGRLVTDFLLSSQKAPDHLQSITPTAQHYAGFSLIVWDGKRLCYFSNRSTEKYSLLRPGLFGLSNHLLDTPWPKVERAKRDLEPVLSESPGDLTRLLFERLADRTLAPDGQLPHTGLGVQWERVLSPIFVSSPLYGTRSSTVVVMTTTGQVLFSERLYSEAGSPEGEQSFSFQIDWGTGPSH